MENKLQKFKPYILNLILIWLAILFYRTNNHYLNFLRTETQTAILFLAIVYTLLGFLYYLNSPSIKSKKSLKTSVLFMLVKIFFLPIMLNFTLNNLGAFKNQFSSLTINSLLTINGFNMVLFPFLLTTIFLIDTLWFSFGYTFESGFLKNNIRSVEPTILGWAVALICYPPFNSFATNGINIFGLPLRLNWYSNDYVLFSTPLITFIIRLLVLLSLGVYVSATLALGTKCSNLTNRGIVSRGPYSIIRHPAYISKNLAWWLTIIPVLSLPAILSMGAWTFIYHLRTITEERHLSLDKDYIEYKKKVKWRYVPEIY